MRRLTSQDMCLVGAGNCGTEWYERELFLNLCGLGGAVYGGLLTLGNPLGFAFGYAAGRAGCSLACC